MSGLLKNNGSPVDEKSAGLKPAASSFLDRATEKMPFMATRQRKIWLQRHNQARAAFLARNVKLNGCSAEIGVHMGAFTPNIVAATQPAKLHLIDPWYLLGPEWDWDGEETSTVEAFANILMRFERQIMNGQIIPNVAFDLELIPELPDDYFDWVYVDTTHQYDHTLAELNALIPKIKTGGVIAGDDWFEEPDHIHHGVSRAILEFVEAQAGAFEFAEIELQIHQWAIRKV
jgi:hypothetical protein